VRSVPFCIGHRARSHLGKRKILCDSTIAFEYFYIDRPTLKLNLLFISFIIACKLFVVVHMVGISKSNSMSNLQFCFEI
jgi:hypothetical protein